MKGPRPLRLLAQRPPGMGRAWEALPYVGNQNRTTKHETDLARMSLCDLWADGGLRVGKLRTQGFCAGGVPSLRGPRWPPTPGIHEESHPLHVSTVLAVSSEVCLLTGRVPTPLEAAGHLLLLPFVTQPWPWPWPWPHSVGCHAFSRHLTPPHNLAKQGYLLSLADK